MKIRFYNRDALTNALTDATSVVFADSTHTYGIKRTDTDEIIVPSGTALTKFDDGSYEYTVSSLPFLSYRYAITWVYNGQSQTIENVILATADDIAYPSYISLTEANLYFNTRLHSDPWTDTVDDDKVKGLITATKIIDTLRFKYRKITYDQPLEFPRLYFNPTPIPIKEANSEIAFALISDVDIDFEYRNLRVTSRRYASVGTTYDTNAIPEYLLAGIPSLTAWNLLRPYLADKGSVRLHRAS